MHHIYNILGEISMPLHLTFPHGGTSSVSQSPHSLLPEPAIIGAFRSVWEFMMQVVWTVL